MKTHKSKTLCEGDTCNGPYIEIERCYLEECRGHRLKLEDCVRKCREPNIGQVLGNLFGHYNAG